MELTKLTHKLTIGGVAHVIDEPIGFDGLKVKISRGNYHGVSAEVSVSKLEFYDNAGRNAASIIRDAYNTDVGYIPARLICQRIQKRMRTQRKCP